MIGDTHFAEILIKSMLNITPLDGQTHV